MLSGESVRDTETGNLPYPILVERLKALIGDVIPQGATVAVVSKGDPDLVALPARRGWHFPQDDRGRYAGFSPLDGSAAVGHLDLLQARGASHVVFPATSRWWLQHYVELADHLERHHAVVADDALTGIIYALSGHPPSRVERDGKGRSAADRLADQIVELVARSVPEDATVAWLSSAPPPAGLAAAPRRVFALSFEHARAALVNIKRLSTAGSVYVVVPAAERGALKEVLPLREHLDRQGRLVLAQASCTIVEIDRQAAAEATTPRPTVLYVCHNHPSVRPGGAEAYALELYRAGRDGALLSPVLLAKGKQPGDGLGRSSGTYFRSVGEDPDQFLFHTDGHDFDGFLGTVTPPDLSTTHFRAFLRAVQPDVVHFQHTLFLGYDLIQEVRTTLPGVPIVYTLHEFLPICHNSGQMVRTEAAGGGLCGGAAPLRCHDCFPSIPPEDFIRRTTFVQSHLELVDLFLAPSEFLAQRFAEWGIPREKIRVEEYGRVPPARVGRTEERPFRDRFGFFGQLTPYKGIDVLLEAMAQLAGEDLPAEPQLWVHGANLELQSGRFQNRVRELDDKAGRSVTFLGPYDHDELPDLMQAIDWVVVPSTWWENSPLVIQEAFAHGRPVICSDIGGMAEKVIDGVNGIHFRAGDVASLTNAIRAATNSPVLWLQLRQGIPAVRAMARHVQVLRDLYADLCTPASADAAGACETCPPDPRRKGT